MRKIIIKNIIIKKIILSVLTILINLICIAQKINCDCNKVITNQTSASIKHELVNTSNNQNSCYAAMLHEAANIYLIEKKLDTAIDYITKSNNYYVKNNCRIPISNYYTTIKIYENQANFKQALAYNLKLLETEKEKLKQEEIAEIYLSIAQIFNRLKQSPTALEYTKKAIPIIEKLPSSESKAGLLNKITARYFFYFQDSKNTTYSDTAWIYVKKALAESLKINSNINIIIAYTRMNAIVEAKGELKLALRYIDSAMMFCNKSIHNRQLTTLYGDKGNIFMQLGNLKLARIYADSCLLTTLHEKYPPIIANAYSLIYEIALKDNNYKDALWALENEKKITDSIVNSKNVEAIAELEKKYNQTKNEQTIENLSYQRKIYILLIAIVICVILFILRYQQQKHKQRIVETEQRLNRARINPHFFFNTLTALQALASKNGNTIEMSENLAKFSHIMREALESTYKEYTTIEQEVDFLNEYLELQSIRFPKRFSYTLIVDENIETDELCLPSMIIEPFIENAIEHGLHNISYEGVIQISFELLQNELKVVIQDNGNGINLTSKAKQNHTPRASQIIKDRIYLLNIKLKTNARFSIQNIENQPGVLVEIYLPIIYKNTL